MTSEPTEGFWTKWSTSLFSPFVTLAIVYVILIFAITFLFWEVSYQSPSRGGVFSDLFFLKILFELLWWGLLGISFIWAIVKFRSKKWQSMLPFLISALPILAIFLSFDATNMWLKYNHWSYASERSQFVKKLRNAPELKTESTWLGEFLRHEPGRQLSIEEGAYVRRSTAGLFVFFPTWFGIPDGFSGFIYAPANVDPQSGWPELRVEWSHLWDEEDNVYFVVNR